MRQIFGEIRWEAKALIFLGLIAIFVVVGPFGSYNELTLAERVPYWTAIMLFVGFFIHVGVRVGMTTRLLHPLRPLPRVLLGVVVGAMPSAAMVALVDQVFRGSAIHMGGLITIWWQVTVIAGVIAPFEYLDFGKTADTAPQTPPIAKTAFHKRLPAKLGADIVSLSMQDHYVEVTTTKGTALVLMRLGDAMAELDGIKGVQLHRSHWAAAGHIRGLSKSGHRQFARLSDGRTLPVSATYADKVQDVAQKNGTVAKD